MEKNRLTVGTLKFWNEEHGTYNKTWEGSFNKELQPHGFGKMDYGDSVYIGNYVNAFREGFGRILYKNGLQFFGRWRHGLKVNDSRLYATGDAVYGIDISAHQHTNGPIDWDKLAIFCDRQGNVYTAKADSEQYVRPVDFVFVRATVGADGKDSTYLENIRQAREHHLLVGSYHVFHLRSSVESQVDNYISLLKYESHDLPPVLDLETDTLVDHLKKMGLTQEQANGMMICWLKEVEDRLGRKPIVYVADRYYGDFIKEVFWIKPDMSDISLAINQITEGWYQCIRYALGYDWYAPSLNKADIVRILTYDLWGAL